ncbi:hypothetical protein LCGC14_0145160 [marine sediment metagenome]|uniref:ribonucleoside-triphosphate reductase (thioredoxin) n=1 Tax=marine sediment metagenome TaxID=412755 RepID=A0A0F9V374_9ZZZZ
MTAPKRLVLTDAFLTPYKRRKPQWGYDALGGVVYKRTYSRQKEDGKFEEWWETIKRVVEGAYYAQILHCSKFNLEFNYNKGQISAQKMYDLIFTMKFLPPGRGLWAMGTKYVEERGAASLNNCGFISTKTIRKHFSYPFTFLMDMSMLGVGVGSDTRGAGTTKMHEPAHSEEIFVVEDSREGWVASVEIILDAFGGAGAKLPAGFDYSKVRKAGMPLKSFGGIASGPEPLEDLHNTVIKMLTSYIGKDVTSTLIVDLFNYIGKCVVAGGIRRTAELMLGFPEDIEFNNLKNPDLFPDELKDYRWASNNCNFATIGMDYEPFVPRIMANGEPSFFWLENARHYGRMKDGWGDWDIFVDGQNPCGEQSLEDGELCCLVEFYPFKHDSLEDMQETLKFAYLYAKSVTLIPTHNPKTNAVIGRNRRIGTAPSGIVQGIQKFKFRNLMNSLDQGYDYLTELDKIYSRWLGVPTSIKRTSVKPSGTISLLVGATPGVHHPHSEYYLRNVRFDKFSPILPHLTEAGYPVEPSIQNDNTIVVSFPVHEEYFSKSKSDVTIWEQFELVASIQRYWSDNQVSVTITVKPEEACQLAMALSMYETSLKSVSLLPLEDHGYPQAPYITIDKEAYEGLVSKIKPLNISKLQAHELTDKFCDGDACLIDTQP